MAETIAWLTTEATPMLVIDVSPVAVGVRRTHRATKELRISDCRMTWIDSHTITGYGIETRNSSAFTALLGDMDVGGIHLEVLSDSSWLMAFGPRMSKPAMRIEVGVPFERHDSLRVAAFPVRNESDGNRVAAALKRAAVLCGAPSSPF